MLWDFWDLFCWGRWDRLQSTKILLHSGIWQWRKPTIDIGLTVPLLPEDITTRHPMTLGGSGYSCRVVKFWKASVIRIEAFRAMKCRCYAFSICRMLTNSFHYTPAAASIPLWPCWTPKCLNQPALRVRFYSLARLRAWFTSTGALDFCNASAGTSMFFGEITSMISILSLSGIPSASRIRLCQAQA